MTTPAARLGAAIAARLDELGLSISAWKRESGVSDLTLRRMRDGLQDSFVAPKERAAERALGWAPGSFDLIRSGGSPSSRTTADVIDVSDLFPDQQEWVGGAVDAMRHTNKQGRP